MTSRLTHWLSGSIIATMMAISTVVVAAELPKAPTASPQASLQANPQQHSAPLRISQRIRRKDIWQEVQKQLPDLPLENQYISSVTGNVSETNTLVRRMIEYHNFRKGRSPLSRFDWKLTLADYLGLHESISANNYPGVKKLKTNPLEGDKAAIQAMDRQQRQQFINTIVSLYNPNIPKAFFTPASPASSASEAVPPSQSVDTAPTRPSPAPITEPGAADLLRPRT